MHKYQNQLRKASFIIGRRYLFIGSSVATIYILNKSCQKSLLSNNLIRLSKANYASADSKQQAAWYNKQVRYWDKQEATVDGVLGGYGHVHEIDIKTSSSFLDSLNFSKQGRALDCGAGIGRVTKDLLIPRFDHVDIVEPSSVLIKQAPIYISSDKVERYYEAGLQDFEFERKYDVIWIQWVLCYLTEEDLLKFLIKCKENLVDNESLIIIKENVCDYGEVDDTQDNSKVRSNLFFEEIFAKAGLQVVKHMYQPEFPEDLFKISLYALKIRQNNISV